MKSEVAVWNIKYELTIISDINSNFSSVISRCFALPIHRAICFRNVPPLLMQTLAISIRDANCRLKRKGREVAIYFKFWIIVGVKPWLFKIWYYVTKIIKGTSFELQLDLWMPGPMKVDFWGKSVRQEHLQLWPSCSSDRKVK